MITEAKIEVRFVEDLSGPSGGRDHLVLRHDTSDPLVVQLVFDPATCASGEGGEPPVWEIERGLLATAGGHHDVHTERSASHLTLTLSPPDGRCVIRFPAAELDEFLARTFKAVPAGSEVTELDIDAALAELLGGIR